MAFGQNPTFTGLLLNMQDAETASFHSHQAATGSEQVKLVKDM